MGPHCGYGICTNACASRQSKNVSGAGRISLALCVYDIRSAKLRLVEKTLSLIRMFGAFTTLCKSSLTFPAREIQFKPSQVRHIASKVSEIVRNFLHFYYAVPMKIAICMDVDAYADVQCMCLWIQFSINLLPNFQNDRQFLAKRPVGGNCTKTCQLNHCGASHQAIRMCYAIRSNELSQEILSDSKVR